MQTYKFHLKDGTIKEAQAETQLEAQAQLNIWPGNFTTCEVASTVEVQSPKEGDAGISTLKEIFAKPARKPRKDKGQTRSDKLKRQVDNKAGGKGIGGQTQPTKKPRARGQFFVFETKPLHTLKDSARVLDSLKQRPDKDIFVVRGTHYEYERKRLDFLKPVKN